MLAISAQTLNAEPIYKRLLPKLEKLVNSRVLVDDAREKMVELKKENPKDERVVKIDLLWDTVFRYDPYNPRFDEILLETAGPITPPPLGPPQVNLDAESLSFSWDLDDRYKFVRSQFTRVDRSAEKERAEQEERVEKMREEFNKTEHTEQEERGFFYSFECDLMYGGPDPLIYLEYFLIDSYLVEVKYRDYLDCYSHGDDLWVTVLFRVPRSLDAVLCEPIRKSLPHSYSSGVNALLL